MRCKWQAHSAGRRRDTWDDRKAARRCRRLRPSLPTDRCRAVSISFCSLENLSGRGAWRAREKPLAWRALFAGGGTSTALTVKKKKKYTTKKWFGTLRAKFAPWKTDGSQNGTSRCSLLCNANTQGLVRAMLNVVPYFCSKQKKFHIKIVER